MKQLVHQEDITIIYMYAPHNTVPQKMKQTLTELENPFHKTVGDSSTLFSVMNGKSIQKIIK